MPLNLIKADDFLCVSAWGVLDARDYQQFAPQFRTAIALHKSPVPMLLELRSTFGWTLSGLLSDVAFDVRYRKSFSRIAVIGHRPWHRPLTALARLLFTAKVRFFTPAEEMAARTWLSKT